MIRIENGWEAQRQGPCHLDMDYRAWFQRQPGDSKVKLEVTLAQRQTVALFPFLKRSTLEAVVDTGSPCTVISRRQFEKSGFRLPAGEATSLGYTGVVKKPGMGVEDVLWGWRDVPIRAYLMNRLYGVELASPTCELHVMVAENVADDKFLLGLDFLSRFRLLLDSGFLVMVGA